MPRRPDRRGAVQLVVHRMPGEGFVFWCVEAYPPWLVLPAKRCGARGARSCAAMTSRSWSRRPMTPMRSVLIPPRVCGLCVPANTRPGLAPTQ